MSRLENEYKTMNAMVKLYCRAHHGVRNELCHSCIELITYAKKRLFQCPFKDKKPTCGNCTVHCYKIDMRQKIKEVMQYSGPRMIWHHPIMSIRHLLDNLRKVPQLPYKNKKE